MNTLSISLHIVAIRYFTPRTERTSGTFMHTKKSTTYIYGQEVERSLLNRHQPLLVSYLNGVNPTATRVTNDILF